MASSLTDWQFSSKFFHQLFLLFETRREIDRVLHAFLNRQPNWTLRTSGLIVETKTQKKKIQVENGRHHSLRFEYFLSSSLQLLGGRPSLVCDFLIALSQFISSDWTLDGSFAQELVVQTLSNLFCLFYNMLSALIKLPPRLVAVFTARLPDRVEKKTSVTFCKIGYLSSFLLFCMNLCIHLRGLCDVVWFVCFLVTSRRLMVTSLTTISFV